MKAFGMNIHIFDPTVSEEVAVADGVVRHTNVLDVARNSDFISIHVPAIKGSTVGMVNDEFIEAMREGAVLLNLSRGTIVNDEALIRGLETKNIWAGLDVFNGEPEKGTEFVSALAQHPRVVGTPHIGASTDQASLAVGELVVEIVKHYMETNTYMCKVN